MEELTLKALMASHRRRFVWVETLDCCWCRDCKNESKFKSLSLSLLTETKRAPPIYGYDTNANNPYIYFSLLAVGKGGTQDHKHSMDFKTNNGSDCERWVQALRVLLQTASNSKRAIVSEAQIAFRLKRNFHCPWHLRFLDVGRKQLMVSTLLCSVQMVQGIHAAKWFCTIP